MADVKHGLDYFSGGMFDQEPATPPKRVRPKEQWTEDLFKFTGKRPPPEGDEPIVDVAAEDGRSRESLRRGVGRYRDGRPPHNS
jgi:hypothetical protein